MCRPFGAVKDHAACPTVSTVGYVVTSLRDFEQHNRRTSDINIDRKFLLGRLQTRISRAGFIISLPCARMRVSWANLWRRRLAGDFVRHAPIENPPARRRRHEKPVLTNRIRSFRSITLFVLRDAG
jgi:hypothetical protein